MDFEVRVSGADLDDAELAESAVALRGFLRDVDGVESAGLLSAGPPPVGAKSGGALAWGSLAVTLVSTGAFQVFVEQLAAWLRRQPVDVTVEIDGQKLSASVSREERAAIVRAYLERVGNGTDPR